MNLRTITARLRAVAICLMLPAALYAVEIEPPKVQLVDKFGVNMANGQVTHRMDIVSIGGAMGLTDILSVYGNEFNFIGLRGFNHKYFAWAKDIQLVPSASPNFSPHNIMRVYGPGGTADFAYYSNGVLQNNGDFTTPYTYVPLGDERNILEVVGNNLEWTRPDGTILRFDRGILPVKKAMSGGSLISIEYPNGFLITITSLGLSVNTNTGFQLKQVFQGDNTFCSATPIARSSDEAGWSNRNPKEVVGINAAVEYCSPTSNCTLTNNWPRATIDWPHCMPDIMFRKDNQIGVTNAQGLTTTYKFTRQDLALSEFGTPMEGYTAGQQWSPRLTGISPPNNSTTTMLSYGYKNLFALQPDTNALYTGGGVDYRLQTAGVATGASRGAAGTPYRFHQSYMNGPDSENFGGGIGSGVSLVRVLGMVQGAVGAIDYADTDDGRIFFEHTPRNFPMYRINSQSAPNESYGYTRGNLSSISYNGNLQSGYYIAAEFPDSCTPSTRKTCNQAIRIRDANGNWTDYTYHPESGQVASITYAANKHGVRAQTRYEYLQFGASYYGSDGVWIAGETNPAKIWLRTAEKSCIQGSASEGACPGGDEVVTQFEYDHNNLLMTGMTVTEPGGMAHRTCYRYDIFGNQIGVTTPNAALGNCP